MADETRQDDRLALLHPDVVERRAALAQKFAAAEPFPHLAFDALLAPELCARLVREFPPFERGDATDDYGRPGRKAAVHDLRGLGGAYAEFDALIGDPAFLSLLTELTGFRDLVYDPEYASSGTHENLSGQAQSYHVDFNEHPRGWQRVLNLLVYLNPEWEESWGGCLELCDSPVAPTKVSRIVPLLNHAVLFAASERSWHGFPAPIAPPAERVPSRRSIAVYFYVKTRDQVPAHSTRIVDVPIPGQIHAGTCLSNDETETIISLLLHRENHIRRLFERESLYLQSIHRLLLQRLCSVDHALTAEEAELLRFPFVEMDRHVAEHYRRELALSRVEARIAALPRREIGGRFDLHGQSGVTHDSWVGPRLRAWGRTTERVGTVEVRGSTPSGIPEQTLILAIGGKQWERVVRGDFAWRVEIEPIDAGREITVEIEAARMWRPSSSGGSTDTRDLSWLLRELRIL